MGMPPGWNRKGLHNLKRKRRQVGMHTYKRQVHPLKDAHPAISILGLEAAKASRKKKKKGI